MLDPTVIEACGACRPPSCSPTGAEKSDACDTDRLPEPCHARYWRDNPYGCDTRRNPEALSSWTMGPQGPGILPPSSPYPRTTGDACVSASPGRVLDDHHPPYPLDVHELVVYLQRADNVSMQAIAGTPPHEISCAPPVRLLRYKESEREDGQRTFSELEGIYPVDNVVCLARSTPTSRAF